MSKIEDSKHCEHAKIELYKEGSMWRATCKKCCATAERNLYESAVRALMMFNGDGRLIEHTDKDSFINRTQNSEVIAANKSHSVGIGTGVVSSGVVQVGASGALSSHHALPHWQVPLSLSESMARRINSKYPVFNWRKGLDDVVFIRERADHALTHFKKLTMGHCDMEDPELRDHIDAVTWFCGFINEVARLCPKKLDEAFYSESRGEEMKK